MLINKCGTTTGYRNHYKNGSEVCEPCRQAQKEYRKSFKEKYPSKERERSWSYYKENVEKINNYSNNWRKRNIEKVKEYQDKYRKTHKENRNQYRLSNLEKFRTYARRRKALKLQNGHEAYTEEQVLELYGTNCTICNESINFDASRKVGNTGWETGFHIDHLVPLSKGGSDTLENVRPAHALCNLQKNAKENLEKKDAAV